LKYYLSIFFVFISFNIYSEEICKTDLISNLSNKDFQKIEIRPNNFKKWVKNSLSIKNSFNNDIIKIQSEFKKKFNSKIILSIKGQKNPCIFKGEIRQAGNSVSHFEASNKKLSQSLSVNLDQPNHIMGITKFKLFRLGSRNDNHEIFITEFLRSINYIAPKTFYIDVQLNGHIEKMIFQEDLSKNLLENMGRREGPIIETKNYLNELDANNKFFSQKIKHELLSFPNSYRLCQSKIINKNWSFKTKINSEISFEALKKINIIFTDYQNNLLVCNGNVKNFNKLNNKNSSKPVLFNVIMISAHGTHLFDSDRKFFYDTVDSTFESIYYDGDVNIQPFDIGNVNQNIDVENYLLKYNDIKNQIDKSDILQLIEKINSTEFKFSNPNFHNKKKILLKNIQLFVDILYDKKNTPKLTPLKTVQTKVLKNFADKNFFYTKNFRRDSITFCDYNDNCYQKKMSRSELSSFFEGELIVDDKLILNLFNFKNTNFQNNNIVSGTIGNIKYIKSKDLSLIFKKNSIIINKNKPNQTILFYDSKIENKNIFFNSNPDFKLISQIKLDGHLLLGCINFKDVKFKNTNIVFKNSNCEDSVNIINSIGDLKNIKIVNAKMDGVDIDFSNLKIKRFDVFNAKNDCLDFSFGQYEIDKIYTSNCNDKGVSIGETSNVNINFAEVKNTKIAIAVKDFSSTKINKIISRNNKSCLNLYKKKQEFGGAKAVIKTFHCDNNIVYFDKFSNVHIDEYL